MQQPTRGIKVFSIDFLYLFYSIQIPYMMFFELCSPFHHCSNPKIGFWGLSREFFTENRPYTRIRTNFGPRMAGYYIRTNSKKIWEAVYIPDRFCLGLSGQKNQIRMWPLPLLSGVLLKLIWTRAFGSWSMIFYWHSRILPSQKKDCRPDIGQVSMVAWRAWNREAERRKEKRRSTAVVAKSWSSLE